MERVDLSSHSLAVGQNETAGHSHDHRVPPKRRLICNGLHGVVSQKIELFITIAVRTSNPTCYYIHH
jgi:hypothetical protein